MRIGIYTNKFLCSYVPLKKSIRNMLMSSHNLKEKIGIVTGGADGIGLACVKELLRQGVKAIVIGDITREEQAMMELRQYGADKTIFKKCDVTRKDQLDDLFKTTMDKYKQIDFVINNAGILDDDEWERSIATNVIASVRGTFLGLKYMSLHKGGTGGVIVNLSSIVGVQSFAGSPTYVGTKHFLVGFGRSIGDHYHFRRTGVKIVTMCPGITLTHMIDNAEKHSYKKLDPSLGKLMSNAIMTLPTQGADVVGRHMINLMTMASSGSVWISEGNAFYEITFPDRKSMRKK